jgi:hypothetical protein
MSEAWEEGRLRPGTRLLLLAFGAGFTWAGATLPWTLALPATGKPGTRRPLGVDQRVAG